MLLWRTRLGEVADTRPLYVSGRLYETAKNGTTYAIDANTGKIVWRFTTHGPKITTSVPAADPNGRFIYAPGVDGYVHKLSASSGVEVRSAPFPVRITLMPETEKNASPLTVANGYLYAATSGYFGDAPPYVGHVVSVRLSDGSTNVFNSLCSNRRSLLTQTTCSQSGSGIWSRGGVVVDPDPSMHGRIYFTTGNGDFNANRGGQDYGDSVISLSADARSLLGYYTPDDYAELENGDVDLGSAAPALLPREPRSKTPLMLVQGGKDSILRLVDRANMRGLGRELQRVAMGSQLYSTPAVWQDPSTRQTWVYLGLADGVRAYRVVTKDGVSRLVLAWTTTEGETAEGTSPVVSGDAVIVAMNGAVYGLDARSGKKLWSGSMGAVHWQSPIVANGRLFCSDQDGNLNAWSL